jgi:hypothetical protein
MPLKAGKRRLGTIVSQKLEQQIITLAEKERRTKSSMAAILLEEAINNRLKRDEKQ